MSYIKSSKILGRFGGGLFMFQKAIIIGCPGAGKSTFARKLSDKMHLPLYYLDMLWHKPDRTTVDRNIYEEIKRNCFKREMDYRWKLWKNT